MSLLSSELWVPKAGAAETSDTHDSLCAVQ